MECALCAYVLARVVLIVCECASSLLSFDPQVMLAVGEDVVSSDLLVGVALIVRGKFVRVELWTKDKHEISKTDAFM